MRKFVEFFRHGFVVPGHDHVDHERVGQAVVHVNHGTQGMGAGVHSTQIFLEGNGAHHGRHHHVAAGFEVAGFMHSCVQCCSPNASAFQGNAIAQGMVGR